MDLSQLSQLPELPSHMTYLNVDEISIEKYIDDCCEWGSQDDHALSMPVNHVMYLKKLSNEIKPKVIYDIGANVLQWTKVAEKIWKDAEIIVFDGFDKLESLYKKNKYPYHIGILSDRDDKEVKWYQNDYLHTGNSYYKENDDNVFPEQNFIIKPTKTLQTVVKERNFPYPDLIKIDVQGCERDILEGAKDVLLHAKDLIIEIQHLPYNRGAPMAVETVPYIQSLGFQLVTPLFSCNQSDGDYHFRRV